MRKAFKMLALVMLLVAFAIPALAEAPQPTVKDMRTEIGENYVAYPQLEGLSDEAVQQRVNDDVVLSTGAARHLVTLSTLGQSSWGLQVDYTAFLKDDIFSVVVSASGKQPTGRDGHAYTALTYDLRTGSRLTLDKLFADPAQAVAYMEESVIASLADELSSHLENGELTPLPVDSFTVDGDGVCFWYPYDQFAYLSEFSGACEFGYTELAPYLISDGDGVPARIGALAKQYTDAEAAAAIRQSVKEGRLPHIPVTLGDTMNDVIQQYRLLRTPDEYPGGRYYTMEAPKLRDVYVISDNISDGWEHSVVEGLRAERGELFGLTIGQSKQEQWTKLLGQPSQAIVITESMSYDYNLPAGQCDVYELEGHELRLYADGNGVLCAIQLSE